MSSRPAPRASIKLRSYRCHLQQCEPRSAPSDVLSLAFTGMLLNQLTPPHSA